MRITARGWVVISVAIFAIVFGGTWVLSNLGPDFFLKISDSL